MSFFYQFGGLTLSSSVAIPGLYSASPTSAFVPDITVSVLHEPPPPTEEVLFHWPGLFQLILGTVGPAWHIAGNFPGAFLLSPDGKHVTVYLHDAASDALLWDVFVRRVLPRCVFLFGGTSIHAASVAGKRGAVLLLGFSGAGKSTFSAAAAHWLGLTLLSDDISVLRHADVPALSPAADGVSLTPDSREALGIPPDHCRPLPAADDKLRFHPPQQIPLGESYPLRAFVSLHRAPEFTEPLLQPIRPAQGLTSAYTQLIKFNPGSRNSPDSVRSFQSLGTLLHVVPSYRFDYPSSFGALRRSVEKLADLL